MMERLKIPFPVIVEGKYDRLRLQAVMEGQIITTDGFGIFKKSEKAGLLKRLSEKSPLIVLTDSDGAGRVIRSHISSLIPKDRLIQLHTPQIDGKEKRKSAPSAEGFLGVEGMENDFLYQMLAPFANPDAVLLREAENPLCKADFFQDGLTGKEDSAKKRDEFAKKLGLPSGMTPNALLAATRFLCSYEEYCQIVGR